VSTKISIFWILLLLLVFYFLCFCLHVSSVSRFSGQHLIRKERREKKEERKVKKEERKVKKEKRRKKKEEPAEERSHQVCLW
jgi:predicted membrane protein